MSLRHSLLHLLLRFCRVAGPVRTQLCLALAALAAHMPGPQFNPHGSVVRWFIGALNGVPPDVAQACMLELLVVIPQARNTALFKECRAAGCLSCWLFP
jgi:transportin-3